MEVRDELGEIIAEMKWLGRIMMDSSESLDAVDARRHFKDIAEAIRILAECVKENNHRRAERLT